MSAKAPGRAACGALLLALALALASCGGGGGRAGSTSAATRAQPPGTTTAPPPSARREGEGEGATTEAVRHPKPQAGGEKSIEDYGSEAGGSEREAVLSAFHVYLEALGARDYASACADLAERSQQGVAQFAPPALRKKGCAAILPHLLAPSAAPLVRRQAEGKVTRVRVRGSRGFVVFHAPGARLYDMPMAREGGEWKVGLVAASVLVPKLP